VVVHDHACKCVEYAVGDSLLTFCSGFKFSELEIRAWFFYQYILLTNNLLTEAVLSLLLSKFQFALSDKEIIWEMGVIAIPTVKGRPGIPTMPLKVIPLQTTGSV
jgi:hypothetical protein